MLTTESWQKNLSELEQNYCITDKILLVKSIAVLVTVVILFFLSSIIPDFELGLGLISCNGPSITAHVMNVHFRLDCHIWISGDDDSVGHQGSGGGDAQDSMVHTPLFCRVVCPHGSEFRPAH